MQSFLINSSNQSFINSKIDSLKEELSVSIYNYHYITPSPSIGIEEIRKLITIINRKSYGGGNRLIYIESFDKATIEATNSILKILEEPPAGTYIVLSCTNLNNLIPTIISRCQIIHDNDKSTESELKNFEKTVNLIILILNSSPGKRLLIAGESVKTRDSALNLLNSMLISLDLCLKEEKVELTLSKIEIITLISKISSAISYLEKNVNFKAVIDILFLGFPSAISHRSQ